MVDTGTGGNHHGAGAELPWASVFDARANIRALSAVQAVGVRAAGALVDRFLTAAGAGFGAGPQPAPPLSAGRRADLFGATDLEPLIRSWWTLLGQFLLGGEPRGAPGGGPRIDLATAHCAGTVTIDGSAPAQLWLHNSGGTDIGPVALHCSPLQAADGSVLPAPVAVPGRPVVPAGARRLVEVELDAAAVTAPPGVYRGVLQIEGHPEVWLPVARTVAAS